jgi:hypothetical protein
MSQSAEVKKVEKVEECTCDRIKQFGSEVCDAIELLDKQIDANRPEFKDSKFEIKRSKIPGAGVGLFATGDLPKGTEIPRPLAEYINDRENIEFIPLEQCGSIDLCRLTEMLSRYMTNKYNCVHTGHSIVLTKDIKAGSEMYRQYGLLYWLYWCLVREKYHIEVVSWMIKTIKDLAKDPETPWTWLLDVRAIMDAMPPL